MPFAGCVLVSDMESWVGVRSHGATGTISAWQAFVQNQRRVQGAAFVPPRHVCLNLQASKTTQAPVRTDVLNIGGFSDAIFDVVSSFLMGDEARFLTEVESISIV